MQIDQEDAIYILIGRNIRSCRKKRGITQQELASHVGYTRTSIVNIEAGRQHMAVHALYAIALALGVTLQDIVIDLPNDLPDVKAGYIFQLEAESVMLREQNSYLRMLLEKIHMISQNKHEENTNNG